MTASRRVVPIHDNSVAWLAPYAGRQGTVWNAGSIHFHKQQQSVAAATAVEADTVRNTPAKELQA